MATTTSTATIAPTTAATTPAAVTAAPDPIRVERGHRTAWLVAGVAVVVLSAAGVVAARTASTSEVPPPTGSAVARADAAESAHGHGSSIHTGAGPVVAAVPTVSLATGPVVHRTPPRGMADEAATTSPQRSDGPVVHRTPPRGMADDAATTSPQRSDGPRNVQPGQPLA